MEYKYDDEIHFIFIWHWQWTFAIQMYDLYIGFHSSPWSRSCSPMVNTVYGTCNFCIMNALSWNYNFNRYALFTNIPTDMNRGLFQSNVITWENALSCLIFNSKSSKPFWKKERKNVYFYACMVKIGKVVPIYIF